MASCSKTDESSRRVNFEGSVQSVDGVVEAKRSLVSEGSRSFKTAATFDLRVKTVDADGSSRKSVERWRLMRT